MDDSADREETAADPLMLDRRMEAQAVRGRFSQRDGGKVERGAVEEESLNNNNPSHQLVEICFCEQG